VGEAVLHVLTDVRQKWGEHVTAADDRPLPVISFFASQHLAVAVIFAQIIKPSYLIACTCNLLTMRHSRPRVTAVPHVFFAHHIDTTSEATTTLTPVSLPPTHPSTHPNNAETKLAIVTPEFAPAALTSSATIDHPHTAQLDLEAASDSPTASFLGIPTEVRCMIYDYLWPSAVDICINSPGLAFPIDVRPIFHVDRQSRSEAIGSLRRHKSLTFNIHAIAEDLDFRQTTSALKDLNNNYFRKEGGGGKKKLTVHLYLRSRDVNSKADAPESFAEFIACLAELGLQADYKFTFTTKDLLDRGGDFARAMIVKRIVLLINASGDKVSSLDSGRARKAVRYMS
jgi:hypothetical protein